LRFIGILKSKFKFCCLKIYILKSFCVKKNPLKNVRAIVRIRSSYLDMMGTGGTVLILIYADLGYWSAPKQYPSQVE